MDEVHLQRLGLLLAFVQHNRNLYLELYERGGGHPQDLARARMCDTLLLLGLALFPEIETGVSGPAGG